MSNNGFTYISTMTDPSIVGDLWRRQITECLDNLDQALKEQKEKEKNKMKLTKEKALRIHRQMWAEMLRDLGDNPTDAERCQYKAEWTKKHFPGEWIQSNCFLCEYIHQKYGGSACNLCPIDWGEGSSCADHRVGVSFDQSPITEILALPERKESKEKCEVDKWLTDNQLELIKEEERNRVIKLLDGIADMNNVEKRDAFGLTIYSTEIIKKLGVEETEKRYLAWKEKKAAEDVIKNLKPQDVIRIVPSCAVIMITYISPDGNSYCVKGIQPSGNTYYSVIGSEQITYLGRIVETTDILGDIKKFEEETKHLAAIADHLEGNNDTNDAV